MCVLAPLLIYKVLPTEGGELHASETNISWSSRRGKVMTFGLRSAFCASLNFVVSESFYTIFSVDSRPATVSSSSFKYFE